MPAFALPVDADRAKSGEPYATGNAQKKSIFIKELPAS
jgi:hypothetical protein